MEKQCVQCSASFEITSRELEFLRNITPSFGGTTCEIPPPTLCPTCREQLRMAHRNERSLYHTKCGKSGRQIISMYCPDEPYKVYDQQIWWSDAYDPLEYGREFDFSRPFFDQFRALELEVPKIAIINAKSENCMYTNYSAENRNCYLVVGGLGAEDCYYSYRVFYSKNICDCYDLYQCERCYECMESTKLYNCVSCTQCHNCSNAILCKDCIGCKDCFGCANLRNKQYYIYNRPFPKEEYYSKVHELQKNLDRVRPDIEALHAAVPHRYAHVVQCEHVSGDQLWECKDCENCFTLKKSRDCAYSRVGEGDSDCFDCNFFDNCERQYMSCNNEKNYNVLFSSLIWYCKETLYSMNCFHSDHLFGCTGMKKHRHCILNRQYSPAQYEALVPKIIEHMQSTGEWGMFFPAGISAFGYNETVANDFVPLTQAEVQKRNWKWRETQKSGEQYLGPTVQPAKTGDICQKILTCKASGRHYKIIPQELAFYESMQLPVPERCPDVRHAERMRRLNPRKLWNRSCEKCGAAIQTTYAHGRLEKVYCEACYQESLV